MRYFRFLVVTFVAVIFIFLNSCDLGTHSRKSPVDPVPEQPMTELLYLVELGLMKGHLLVANELLGQGTPDQAEPHLGHPIEEIYLQIDEPLQAHKIPEFKTTLIKLHELAKYAPANPDIKTGYEASINSINMAINAIPQDKRQSPEFVIKAIGEILQTMADEYTAAVANNKIVARIEYQDARGFMIYAEELYGTIANQMTQQSSTTHQAMTQSLDQLKKGFPSVNPPKVLILQPNKVSEIVKTIQGMKVS